MSRRSLPMSLCPYIPTSLALILRCHPLGLLDGPLDCADHVEGLLRELVVAAFEALLEALDGLLAGDVLRRRAGEDFGDAVVLREVALDAACAGDRQLVVLRQLFDTENRDDVLQVAVALQDSLHLTGGSVVLLA